MRIDRILIALTLAVVALSGARPGAADAPTRIAIGVTESGFTPDHITVPADQPVALVFTRTTEKGCVKRVVVHTSADRTVEKALPLNKPVEIVATFAKGGELRYACGMDMVSGTITVR
jgi:plastocyanin domain-containing protein